MSEVVTIIPSRYGSSRLPGKPLRVLAGKPLILHVVERAKLIDVSHKIIVATDDRRVAQVAEEAGMESVLTPEKLPTGSDRVGWVAKTLSCDIIVNLQGDEPLIDVESVRDAIHIVQEESGTQVATLGFPLTDESDWRNPNVVKVLTDSRNRALYFSRQPVPFFRDGIFRPLPVLFHHQGIYVFRREILLKFLNWEPSPLENAEKLEQLRWLAQGCSIKVVRVGTPSYGVDTPDDLKRVEGMLK